jgi:hypothetical protein
MTPMDKMNALANLYEDITGAQMMLDAGAGSMAKIETDAACDLFRKRCPDAELVYPTVDLNRISVQVGWKHETITLVARRFYERLP